MASNTFFDNPPLLQGQEKQQLQQVYNYLMAMSDKLNQALMTITIDQMTPETQAEIRKSETAQNEQAATLKSLIIKTAQIVRHEMDEISTRLQDEYTALSDEFGEYQRDLVTTITATAQGILQDYRFSERIDGLAEDAEIFKKNLSQYIFTGLIDEVEGKVGIAIGENVTGYDEQDEPYYNTNTRRATFVMDELAFWQGETKLAYFKNNVFHIAQGEVTKSMKMGMHTWTILADGSMGLISGS